MYFVHSVYNIGHCQTGSLWCLLYKSAFKRFLLGHTKYANWSAVVLACGKVPPVLQLERGSINGGTVKKIKLCCRLTDVNNWHSGFSILLLIFGSCFGRICVNVECAWLPIATHTRTRRQACSPFVWLVFGLTSAIYV